MKRANHIFEGSIFKALLMIAVPVTFANIFQAIYQLTDIFWVGRLNKEAVAAVSLSFPVLFFLTTIMVGFAMAGAILIAQYNGRGNKKRISLTTGQMMIMALIFSVFMTFIGYFSSRFLLSFLTDDAVVLASATSYLKISFLAFGATLIYSVCQSSLQGVGEVRIPTQIILVTVIMNFVLDPLFMKGWGFVPALGVSGVAIATLITEYFSAFFGLFVIMNGKYIKLKLNDLKLRVSGIKKLFSLGLPLSLELSSFSFGMVLMTFIVSVFGTLAVASYGVGIRIFSFLIIPSIGLSIATTLLVGNNLGAKKYERAEKIFRIAVRTGFWSLLFLGVLLFIFAKQITGFFVPEEPGVIIISSRFIRIMALTFGFVGFQMVVMGALKGAGKTKTSLFLMVFNMLLIFLTGYILSFFLGLRELGVWLAYPISNFLGFLVAFYFYLRRGWIREESVFIHDSIDVL